jgi:hypothetical protein
VARILPIVVVFLAVGPLVAGDITEPKYVDHIEYGKYSAWPAYKTVRISDIKPQPWRFSDDITEGWDWSLPPSVGVSNKSLLCVTRNARNLPKVNFPANPVVSIWVRWKDLEPKEGKYEFDKLIADIKRAEQAGYGVVIRPMTAVWEALAHPDESKTSDRMRQSKKCAPDYLVTKYNVPRKKQGPKKNWRLVNLDVTNKDFHRSYLKLAGAFGKAGVPQMKAVKGIIVGYASSSWGDEGVGPHGKPDPPHVKERLDAWAGACKGVEHKVCMGGVSPYGLDKGFGTRGGFVEMYMYMLPKAHLGQGLDKDGYVTVDETVPIIKTGAFSGDENEEYDKGWTHRFGPLESFTYRYFTSSLRVIQMRRNYLLHSPFSIFPEMLPYVSQEMGRTVKDTPDVWCFLRESYLRPHVLRKQKPTEQERKLGTPARNFERWLYQRDAKGFETFPAVKIKQPMRIWVIQNDRRFDFVARAAKRIGFAIDDRFLAGGPHEVAVKISYFDMPRGVLSLQYKTPNGMTSRTLKLGNTGKLKTATFFLSDAIFDAKGMDYDLTIAGDREIVVSFVRVIKPGKK